MSGCWWHPLSIPLSCFPCRKALNSYLAFTLPLPIFLLFFIPPVKRILSFYRKTRFFTCSCSSFLSPHFPDFYKPYVLERRRGVVIAFMKNFPFICTKEIADRTRYLPLCGSLFDIDITLVPYYVSNIHQSHFFGLSLNHSTPQLPTGNLLSPSKTFTDPLHFHNLIGEKLPSR